MKAVREEGLTLIELITVITITGILLLALGFQFSDWMGRYKVESEIKEMYVDLMSAKARAMKRDRVYFVSLTATRYTINEDVSPWPDGDGTLTSADNTGPAGYTDPIPFLNKDLNQELPITWSGTSDAAPQIQFSKRGLAAYAGSNNYAICSNTTSDADYNCIEISETRIEMGKVNIGDACNAANCVVK
jgi:Tfp pilus assembly protein FimT